MKLSVMIITYNHERFIGQALESVLAQRVNFDYEIVIGEDCSTDATRDIVMDFHRRYPDRIVALLRSHNVGGKENFLDTLARCRGQYVALLDGDDYWISGDKLQKQVDFLDAHRGHAICCSRAQVLDERGSGYASFLPFPPVPAGSYTLNDLLRGNFVVPSTTVYRRDAIGSLPKWFRTLVQGDWALFALIARQGKIVLMDEALAMYRMHWGGIWSARPLADQLTESIRALKALDEHLEFQHTSTIRRTIARYHWDMAALARQQGERMETMKHIAGYLRKGGLRFPGSKRPLAALVAYALLGTWYEAIRKAKQASRS
ncbi:MAG TPA: glycosyltransferase [Terriglobia bacterium]|nr:glycosyltransferase [Terriglobia bacterium]